LEAPFLRHVADPQLNGRAGHVRDDDAPVAIEERAARSLYANEAELVRLRGASEDRDSEGELRGESMRLPHPRVGGEEAARRRAPFLVRPGGHLGENLDLAGGLEPQLVADDRAHESID